MKNSAWMKESGKKKMPKTFKGKSTKPGGGGRFAMMEAALMEEGKSKEQADAIAAAAGRKRYGKKKFQEMAAVKKKFQEMAAVKKKSK